MELAGPAAGDEAAPLLVDEGGADEARGVVGREAEEDILDQRLNQSAPPPALAPDSSHWIGFGTGKVKRSETIRTRYTLNLY